MFAYNFFKFTVVLCHCLVMFSKIRDLDSDGDAMLQLIKFGLHNIYHILIQFLHIFVVSANKNTNNPFSYFLHLNNCYQAAAV